MYPQRARRLVGQGRAAAMVADEVRSLSNGLGSANGLICWDPVLNTCRDVSPALAALGLSQPLPCPCPFPSALPLSLPPPPAATPAPACVPPVADPTPLYQPRWGRCQEGYGECPYLTAEIARVWIRGLQGHPDAKYVKVGTISKHFAAHTGPESPNNREKVGRMAFDSQVTQRALHEHFLPAFRAAAETGTLGFMCSCNAHRCFLAVASSLNCLGFCAFVAR